MIQNEQTIGSISRSLRRSPSCFASRRQAPGSFFLSFVGFELNGIVLLTYCEQLWLVVWPNMENEEAKNTNGSAKVSFKFIFINKYAFIGLLFT